MSVEPKKALSKLRTFAQDLEAQRKKDGIVTPSEVESSAGAKTGPHIPAFHELQKKTPVVVAEATPIYAAPTYTAQPAVIPDPQPQAPVANRVSTEKKIIVQAKRNPAKTGGGKIITDNKNNRVKLIPAVLKSFNTWVATTLASLKKKEPPKYTVADAERRKGVIQKSTTKTGSIFTADNETLKEEIRRRQLQSAAQSSSKNDITWSPNTEVGYPLLEAAGRDAIKTTNVQVDFKKQTTPAPPAAVVIEPPAPQVVVPPIAPEVLPPPVENVPPVILAPEKIVMSELELDPVIDFEEPEPTYETPPLETPTPTPAPTRRSFNLRKIKSLNTNTQTIVIVGLISGIILMIFIVRGVIGILSPDQITIQTTIPAEPITNVVEVVDITLKAITKDDLLGAIATIPTTTVAVTEFRFVDSDGTPIATQELLQGFAFTTNPNFNQSVSDLHLVTVGNQRALVFKVIDPTTVFGALLEWEPVMLAELNGVFSFSTRPSGVTFTDTTIEQRDIRTLMAGGEQVLVYGFTDINVVVITENTTVFKTILDGQ